MARFLALAVILLAGCATQPQVITRVVTKEVKVPIPVRLPPPPEAVNCRQQIPQPPLLKDAPGGVLIPTSQIPNFQDYIAGWARCDAIWRAGYGSNQ